MLKINPLLTRMVCRNNASFATSLFRKPQITNITSETIKNLRYIGDEVSLSTQKRVVSLEEVKALFPTGKLENNYIIRDIKDLLSRLETERKIIDLTPELSDKDYKIIQNIINMDNGRYIEKWKGYSDTDLVPNMQKLALFTRTMRLTKQTNEFLEFNPTQWEIAYEGIVRKPKETIMPLLEYKANSDPINIPLGRNRITSELKDTIDKITSYLDMFSVKQDFVGFRGDKTFNILSNIKSEGQNINLGELIERYTKIFRNMYLEKSYDVNAVNDFVKKYIIDQKIYQTRFMSIGMTENSIKNYAKKIKWKIKIPAGTKGASIESFNVERMNEAEFLGQRNGQLIIEKARYCPKKDLWYFDAVLEQKPVDKLIVNC